MRVSKKLKERLLKELIGRNAHIKTARMLLDAVAGQLRNSEDKTWQTAIRLAAEKGCYVYEDDAIFLLDVPPGLSDPGKFWRREFRHPLGFRYAQMRSDIRFDNTVPEKCVKPLSFRRSENGRILNDWGIRIDSETEELIAAVYAELDEAYKDYEAMQQELEPISSMKELVALYPEAKVLSENRESKKNVKPVQTDAYINERIKEAIS